MANAKAQRPEKESVTNKKTGNQPEDYAAQAQIFYVAKGVF